MSLVQDWTFGNRGTTWSGVPQLYQVQFSTNLSQDEKIETHYVGGTVTGLHVLAGGLPCVVTWGWTYAEPWETSFTTVRLVRFPLGGTPQEFPRWDGARVFDLSEPGRYADPLASCSTASGQIAVLIRQSPVGQRPGTWTYAVSTIDPAVQLPSAVRTLANPGLFYDSLGQPQPRPVRMVLDGQDLVVASSWTTRLRLGKLVPGATAREVDLAGTPALPGLTGLDVASLRFMAGAASVGLTAYLNHPGVGPTSVGAVLRLRPDGTRDPGFADNGLWVSPLGLGYRGFLCAGEMDGLVAGSIDRRAVVFALDPYDTSGGGLDGSYAGGGFAEWDLGGPLASAISAADADGIYVVAQRVPGPAGGLADLRTVGCRFRSAPGTPNHGLVDGAWGTGGTLTIRCDGAPVTPAGLVVLGPQLFIGATRQARGTDLDRIPVVVALNAASGDHVPGFGSGGVALHSSVTSPALVDSDGSAVFVERAGRDNPPAAPALRRTNAAGEVGPLWPLGLPSGSVVMSLTRLPDGGLLAAGGGQDTWVVKLDAAGVPDPTFGTAGLARPRPAGAQGTVRALGVRPNGDIVLRIAAGGADELALMHPDGTMDTAYGTGGSVGIEAFTHPGAGSTWAEAFLDEDGSVILVVSNEHAPGQYASPWVTVALRRVTAAGAYDPTFGLGALSVNPPAPSRVMRLPMPAGGTSGDDEYSSIDAAGIAWLGGRLYVIATGWTGGRYISQPGFNVRLPTYPLLLVLAWQADGSVDTALDGGFQEAGWSPDRLYWSAAGVLRDSPTSLYAYGLAGEAEQVTSSLPDGTTWTSTLVRQPQPAVFRVEHPSGLVRTFGGDGAATVRLQEVLLSPVAGALVGNRVRVGLVDVLGQPSTHRPKTNFGALVQWAPSLPKPPHPPGPHPFPRPPRPIGPRPL